MKATGSSFGSLPWTEAAQLEIFLLTRRPCFGFSLHRIPRISAAACMPVLSRSIGALMPYRLHYIKDLRSPLILIHGFNDPAIPAQQSIEFAAAARANGLANSLTLLRMYGHVHPILP